MSHLGMYALPAIKCHLLCGSQRKNVNESTNPASVSSINTVSTSPTNEVSINPTNYIFLWTNKQQWNSRSSNNYITRYVFPTKLNINNNWESQTTNGRQVVNPKIRLSSSQEDPKFQWRIKIGDYWLNSTCDSTV